MTTAQDPQLYFHVRIVMGMILGLSVTRLLSGFARFIQHPAEHRASLLHLGWAASTLLAVILFWWWEYRLAGVESWNFFIYLFVLIYTSLFYFMCALLFPDHLGEYASYTDYFNAKRVWFFSILAFSHLMDIGDTFLKTGDHLHLIGKLSIIETVVMVIGCLIAMRTSSRHFQMAFLILALLDQFVWIGLLLEAVA